MPYFIDSFTIFNRCQNGAITDITLYQVISLYNTFQK